MFLMLKLASIALVITIAVWGVFGYVMAQYLMAEPELFRRKIRQVFWSKKSPPLIMAHNMAAAVAFTLPQPMIIELGNPSDNVFQLPKDIRANNVTITAVYKIER
jgi:hypothetical protein